MGRFPNCILLTRVGNFYESYFEQAPELAGLLGIKLAKRWWGGREVFMAGFPVHQMEKYLKVLLQDHGRLVAICEEFKSFDSKAALLRRGRSSSKDAEDEEALKPGGLLNEAPAFERKVTRIVSPGTLIDEKFLDQYASNFIVSATAETPSSAHSSHERRYGLAWLDIGTASFHTMTCSDAQSLRDQIARISPKEAVLQPGVFGAQVEVGDRERDFGVQQPVERWQHPVWEALPEGDCMISFADVETPGSGAGEDAQPVPEPSTVEEQATAQLTRYVELRLLELSSQSGDASGKSGFLPVSPERMLEKETMQIDAHTLAALEVRSTARENSARGSLVSAARRTVTRGGARLLEEWLSEFGRGHCIGTTHRADLPFLLQHAQAPRCRSSRTVKRSCASSRTTATSATTCACC